jgi:hypothetical protein
VCVGIWKNYDKAARAAGKATKKVKVEKAKAAKLLVEKAATEEQEALLAIKLTKAYTWDTPVEVQTEEHHRRGWSFLRNKSKLLKEEELDWEKRQCPETGRVFYYNPVQGTATWDYPDDLCSLYGMPTAVERGPDPSGTKCRHNIMWEKCKRCKKEWKKEEGGYQNPPHAKIEHFSSL